MSFSSFNSEGEPRVRRRDRLRSLAQTTTFVIKKEINKYYEGSPPPLPPRRPRSVMSTTSNEPISTEIKRTDTEEIDDIIKNSVPDLVQPQCMLFPTYACQVDDDEQEVHWKIHLAGWAFANPGSSRLDRWLLAAGRTYGGLSRDTVEDNHFTTLLNQFRCETMRMTDIQLTLPGIIAKKIIDDNEERLEINQQEKIRDFAASVNTGPNGRFEEEIYLDTASVKKLKEQSKYLTVEASFTEDEETPFPGYIDIIDPYGISVISDIDDTIKITDILDGKDAILQNTFFRTAREVPYMSEVFRTWVSEGAHIHYVSNSPWQVYPALSKFIVNQKFPQGSMHLRAVSTQELIIGKPGKHKLDIIPKIIRDFPHRKFILVGDSGEIDPEISLRKFLSRESKLLKKGPSSALAIDAMASTELPDEQEQSLDPEVPLLTKLEQFDQRMQRVSSQMREGVFTVFSLASQLMLDPVVAEEFLMSKTSDMKI
ncbi:hypothetical protein INT48_008792 [Thamnidium elegans]|uniref:Phosphatidate phosphatase APP1 catalytic domain-containing protein n=1 Tax=Thamnidium elegans TaxID=101142 RepID=A0A8H7SLR4_9FUNG|nr:hypothetical protein INT48_008792 [Thamnidium elegans]